jgi:hypothetical protein
MLVLNDSFGTCTFDLEVREFAWAANAFDAALEPVADPRDCVPPQEAELFASAAAARCLRAFSRFPH